MHSFVHTNQEKKHADIRKLCKSTRYERALARERRAWDSNPQPVTRHLNSNQDASHSLTLQKWHEPLMIGHFPTRAIRDSAYDSSAGAFVPLCAQKTQELTVERLFNDVVSDGGCRSAGGER